MNIPIASQNINFPGYGMFWVANSISSTLLGGYNRIRQEEMAKQSEEFQLKMERLRNLTEDEKLSREIAFKRRLMALARMQKQEVISAQFVSRMKLNEFGTYVNNYWPLRKEMTGSLLSQIEKSKLDTTPKLNVILMHTPILRRKKYGEANTEDENIYNLLEYKISHEDVPVIGHLRYHEHACVKTDLIGGNASVMNIHFLMSPLPTLVITPHFFNDKMYFSGAVWEAQASRPFMRQLFSIDYLPDKAEGDLEYRSKMIEKIHTCISVIVGTVRDSFMLLTQFKSPTMYNWLNDDQHKTMKQIAIETKEICEFIMQENINTLTVLDENKNAYLLEVYNKEDVEDMKQKLQSNVFK